MQHDLYMICVDSSIYLSGKLQQRCVLCSAALLRPQSPLAPYSFVNMSYVTCSSVKFRTGRLQINLLTRVMDIALLVGMAAVSNATRKQRYILVGMHLMRMAAGNAGRPLMRSLLMDNVSKRHRGKINALDSVRAMSWSGSAALGGYVSCFLGPVKPYVIQTR